ncbi:MAG: DUF5812 family protein [Halobacteriales archaeon]
MDEKAGTFYVRAADEATAELADVEDGQVFVLSSNPGLDPGDIVEGTVAADPPLGVSWSLVAVDTRYRVTVEALDEAPAPEARSLVESLSEGELAREELPNGERHVLKVPAAETAAAVEDLVGEETTRRRAARIGARRAEVRGRDGVVAVRYLKE